MFILKAYVYNWNATLLMIKRVFVHTISKLVLFMYDESNLNFNKNIRVYLLLNIKYLIFVKY
jgi:hypothetical protein